MKVRDRNIKQMVNVADKECPKRKCYWPRLDLGEFTQGVGYRTRNLGCKPELLCGYREITGCPAKYCHNAEAGGLTMADTTMKFEPLVRRSYVGWMGKDAVTSNPPHADAIIEEVYLHKGQRSDWSRDAWPPVCVRVTIESNIALRLKAEAGESEERAKDDNLRRLVGMLGDKLQSGRKELLDATCICSLVGFDTTQNELSSVCKDIEDATQQTFDWLHSNAEAQRSAVAGTLPPLVGSLDGGDK